jgi:hypothetical protein
MTPYLKGTLMKVVKESSPSGIVDMSKTNLYGYILDHWKSETWDTLYYSLYLFPNGNQRAFPQDYLTPA